MSPEKELQREEDKSGAPGPLVTSPNKERQDSKWIASETSPPALFITWVPMEIGGVVLKEIGENNIES